MAAYRRVYDSPHMQADCVQPADIIAASYAKSISHVTQSVVCTADQQQRHYHTFTTCHTRTLSG